MKKLHNFLVCLMIFALVLAFPGCGANDTPTTVPTTVPTTAPTTVPTTEPPMTVDQVYASVEKAMKDAQPTRLKIDLSYEMTVTEGEGDNAVSTDLAFDMVVDTQACEDPFGSYILMDMAVQADGQDMGYEIEVFLVEESDSVVAYSQMFGTWTRVDYGMTVADFLKSGNMTEISTGEVWSGNALLENMTLDPGTTTLNGSEVYVLHAKIPAGDMSESLGSLGIEDTSAYKDLTLPVTYYVDTNHFTILRMEADLAFMQDLIDDVLAQSLIGTGTENAQIEMVIPNMVFDLGYGVPEIPSVPQEAYDATKENESEPTEYDGPLVLNCGSEALLLTCPEGYSADYVDETNIMLYTGDYDICGDYYYFEDMSREDVLNLANINADFLESEKLLVSKGEGPSIEGYETWAVIGTDQSYYYAWREAGDGWLLLEVYDFSGTDDAAKILPQLIGCISPYHG